MPDGTALPQLWEPACTAASRLRAVDQRHRAAPDFEKHADLGASEIMAWRPGHTRSVIAALDFSHTAGRRIPYASSPYGRVMQLEQARNEPAQTEGAGISTLLDSRESRPWSIARFGAVVTTTRQHL
jgi:hypothetical protein